MPKLSVPIDDKLYDRLQKAFPWGTQAAVIRRVVELLLDKIEKDGYNVIELLISGRYNPSDIQPKDATKTEDV